MKSKISFFVLSIALVVSLVFTSTASAASTKKVKISLPNFPITMNYQEIKNDYRQYPFIVYNDITYFPMTYFDSRFLSVKTNWSNQTGLEIATTDELSVFEEQKQSWKNAKNDTATIATFPIKVNGKIIDNAKETYPLLVFRDVTYFPLTWRFAVEEFGWNYDFTKGTGLSINNPKYPDKSKLYNNNLTYIFDYDNKKITVMIAYGRFPTPNNLTISVNNEPFQTLGNPEYYYGWRGGMADGNFGLRNDYYVDFKDGYIYINALKMNDETSHLYKVHYQTGEMEVLD